MPHLSLLWWYLHWFLSKFVLQQPSAWSIHAISVKPTDDEDLNKSRPFVTIYHFPISWKLFQPPSFEFKSCYWCRNWCAKMQWDFADIKGLLWWTICWQRFRECHWISYWWCFFIRRQGQQINVPVGLRCGTASAMVLALRALKILPWIEKALKIFKWCINGLRNCSMYSSSWKQSPKNNYFPQLVSLNTNKQ